MATEVETEAPAEGRRKDDAYMTPQPLADAIVAGLPFVPEGRLVIEPSCGDGRFVRAMRAAWPGTKILAVDVRPECRAQALAAGADVFMCGDWPAIAAKLKAKGAQPVVVIGNPPYNDAQAHIEAGLALSPMLAIHLLRIGFLGSMERVPFYAAHPLTVLQPVAPRPSYTDDGKSDSSEYATFSWVREDLCQPSGVLPPLVWARERRKK